MEEGQKLWSRFKKYLVDNREIGIALDVSRVSFPDNFFDQHQTLIASAFGSMAALEEGAIANPDEGRMVGHYWLRDAQRAPSAEIATAIQDNLTKVRSFAAAVHGGAVSNAANKCFKRVLVIGIGGSALGPQFVSRALGTAEDKMEIYFIDNTDPDGIALTLSKLGNLSDVIVLVISKSGGTAETRNGMLLARAAWENQGLDFAQHAVAITGEGSKLFAVASADSWLEIFPMWDWVGGRTSEMSAVGLLPAALQGIDVDRLLKGAREMDETTRVDCATTNPAAVLALMWYHIGAGVGDKDMVVLPYKDRLELFSRYLQQLVMESLGKSRDLEGREVEQGISVYGNKGSTDQHAYIQQLRDGLNNFFVTFIEVLDVRSDVAINKELLSLFQTEVEENVTCGDFLSGFYQGTRTALYESGRESITITIDVLSAETVGALIALFERAVGLYASMININAYHQPGVEAGKRAATSVIGLQREILEFLSSEAKEHTAEEIAAKIERAEDVEATFKILRNLAANGRLSCAAGETIFGMRFSSAVQ